MILRRNTQLLRFLVVGVFIAIPEGLKHDQGLLLVVRNLFAEHNKLQVSRNIIVIIFPYFRLSYLLLAFFRPSLLLLPVLVEYLLKIEYLLGALSELSLQIKAIRVQMVVFSFCLL